MFQLDYYFSFSTFKKHTLTNHCMFELPFHFLSDETFSKLENADRSIGKLLTVCHE